MSLSMEWLAKYKGQSVFFSPNVHENDLLLGFGTKATRAYG